MDMTPLDALRAIGCTDDEIRAGAEWLTNPADVFDEYAGNSEPHLTPLHRANAVVKRDGDDYYRGTKGGWYVVKGAEG